MFDLIQFKVIFIVIMGALVVIQILLKLILQRLVLRLCRKHIRILAWIGGHHAGGCQGTHHQRAA